MNEQLVTLQYFERKGSFFALIESVKNKNSSLDTK